MPEKIWTGVSQGNRKKEKMRIELEGEITCIHHDGAGIYGRGLFNPKNLSYSVLDVKVEGLEMRIIRSMTDTFK